MKKALKLVWMVLFALPMVAFTACGDDDKDDDDDNGGNGGTNTELFADYSPLVGKTRSQVINYMGNDPIYEVDGVTMGYYVDRNNVETVVAMFELDDVTSDRVLAVASTLDDDLNSVQVTRFLDGKYTSLGDSGTYYFYTNSSQTLMIAYDIDDNTVMYYDMAVFDEGSRAGGAEAIFNQIRQQARTARTAM